MRLAEVVFFFLLTRTTHQILLSLRFAAICCDPLRSAAMSRMLFIASVGTVIVTTSILVIAKPTRIMTKTISTIRTISVSTTISIIIIAAAIITKTVTIIAIKTITSCRAIITDN